MLRASLIISCAVLFSTFLIIPQAAGLGPAWYVLALAAPVCLVSLRRPEWLKWSYYALLCGLGFCVALVSFDLWRTVLGDERIDVSLHVLALVLSLLLAGSLYAQRLLSPEPEQRRGPNQWVAEGMRSLPTLLSALFAIILCSVLLAFLHTTDSPAMQVFTDKILDRGVIPPLTITLFLWGLTLITGKWLMMRRELRAAQAGQSCFHKALRLEPPADFSNTLWQQFEAFYTLPRYINWAIPILGFIGTVLGISLATERLSAVLSQTDSDFTQLLSEALGPLGIAFDTTLVALSLSIVLALSQALLYRWEEARLLQLEEDLKS